MIKSGFVKYHSERIPL